MSFQPDPDRIVWRLHLARSPSDVFAALDSDEGRASFWAESAIEHDGVVDFRFVNGERWSGAIGRRQHPEVWSVDYFGGDVTFTLSSDGRGGTDLVLEHHGVPAHDRAEVTAGWLNVLLPMKAALDFGVDLHNHDPERSWDDGYVDH